ncbi:MAG: RNA methyltransferase, partial [Burkholderiales bacterium]|nr:RNA methyltransferase [Burkholderiales bacterium]
MPAVPVQFISSRDNPLLKDLRRLAQDSTAYR